MKQAKKTVGTLTDAAVSLHKLEQLAQRDTAIHRLHPLGKLLVTCVYILTVISFGRHQLGALLPLALYPVLLAAFSDTPWCTLLLRLVPALPVALMGGVSNLFFERAVAFYVHGIPVSLGLLSCASILVKTILTVLAVLLLAATTHVATLSAALLRLGAPPVLILQLTMTYRYIRVLLEEAQAMTTAYHLRAPFQKGIRMRDMGCFTGQLLLRSMDRARRVWEAVLCRGGVGIRCTGAYPRGEGMSWRDTVYVSVATAACLLGRIVDLGAWAGKLF